MNKSHVMRLVRSRKNQREKREQKIAALIENIRFWREAVWSIGHGHAPQYVKETIADLERQLQKARAA